MSACHTGCMLRGKHSPGCVEPDSCQGCVPRPALDGANVCERCHSRLRHALAAAPSLVMHIRDHLQKATGATYDDDSTSKSKKFPPAPLDVNALSAADDLHADLASWAAIVIEERHVTGPDWTGSDIRPASKRQTVAGTVYEDARVVGVLDWTATLALSRWLVPHVDWMVAQEWAGELCAEIPEKVRTLTVRYPIEQRPVYLPIPCPECKCQSLRRYAPRDYGLPVTVACWMVDCDWVVGEDGFEWAARVLREQGAA